MTLAPITNIFPVKDDRKGTLMLRDFQVHLHASSRSERTIKKRLYDLRRFDQIVPLTEATRDDIETVLAANRHLAAETRRGLLASLRLFYKWAHDTGRILENPTVGIETIKIPRRYPRIAPDTDIAAALHRAPLDVKAMIMLARYACLRLTELTTLPQSAREGNWLRVIGKGNKERIVYCNNDLLHVLKAVERERPGKYYFPGRYGGTMHPMSVNKIITRETGWNPHSLRHAGATAAYRATRDLRAVQAMLGHASLATTQRYLHVDEDGLRAVAEATRLAA